LEYRKLTGTWNIRSIITLALQLAGGTFSFSRREDGFVVATGWWMPLSTMGRDCWDIFCSSLCFLQ